MTAKVITSHGRCLVDDFITHIKHFLAAARTLTVTTDSKLPNHRRTWSQWPVAVCCTAQEKVGQSTLVC